MSRSIALRPLWTISPVSAWNITAPTAKTSVRASTASFLPCACSGDMYEDVPMIVPLAVGVARILASR
ncbi:MAG TPA: hypothetical protein PLP98_03095, partial [Plasticicumulans sp.]|nr:hypothetical protein [Plasticicumulans sp.]